MPTTHQDAIQFGRREARRSYGSCFAHDPERHVWVSGTRSVREAIDVSCAGCHHLLRPVVVAGLAMSGMVLAPWPPQKGP